MTSSIHEIDTALIALAEIPERGCTTVEARVNGELESLIIYREGNNVRGWLNICPHAGRRLDWAPGQFLFSKAGHLLCASHGASFSLTDGACVNGPCRGDTLRPVVLGVHNGSIYLD